MWPTAIGASAAGASARARYRALAAEHRVERLLTGIVLGASAAVLVAGFLGWQVAGGAALLVLISYANAHRVRPGPIRNWRLGAAAERRTGRCLATLDAAFYRVLHDRALPTGFRRNLDHLVIGPTGVYAIVTRRWRRWRRLWSDHHRLWAGTTPVTGHSDLALRTARLVAELLAAELGEDVQVAPLLVVHGVRAPRSGLRHGRVVVLRARRVAAFIDGRTVVLDEARIRAIAGAAERVLPPMPVGGRSRRAGLPDEPTESAPDR